MLIQINQDLAGLRLDKVLCKSFDISFGLAQKIIREKKVKVNSVRVDPSYKVNELDRVEIFTDIKKRHNNHKIKAKISDQKVKNFFSKNFFEDENMIAINKPSGLATQGGSGVEISVDDFVAHKKWQLVHRLDKDTSGILLIAKNPVAAEFLTNSFKNKTIAKTYLAMVHGVVKKESGIINIPLKKKFLQKNEKVLPDFSEGKEAITNFKLLGNFVDHALLELKPITGRTHQLRVHCKEIGHPILNDVKYGGREVLRKDICSRLCLHAYKIEFSDYFGKKLTITADMPEFIATPVLF